MKKTLIYISIMAGMLILYISEDIRISIKQLNNNP